MASANVSAPNDSSVAVIHSIQSLRDQRPDQTDRPWVTLCYAQSLDGSIALDRGSQTSISGSESMVVTHAIRSWHDAILVGIGTVIADDPQLTVRMVQGNNPTPVILDSGLRCPPHARCLGHGNAIVFTSSPADPRRADQLTRNGTEVVEVQEAAPGRLDLGEVLADLKSRGIGTLMVEGGGAVIQEFLKDRIANGVVVTIAPVFMDGYRPIPSRMRQSLVLNSVSWHLVGRDVILVGAVG